MKRIILANASPLSRIDVLSSPTLNKVVILPTANRPSRSTHSASATTRTFPSPRKQFGQHFLTDRHIIQKIVTAAELEPGQVVLEIGPGRGHLTRVLAENAGARVCAVELDRDLAARLQEEFHDLPNVTILEGDFLSQMPETWLAQAGTPERNYKVVANLPYYITSAILRHLLEAEHKPTVIVVMVQREVAQQIAAQPPQMNLLAVSVQFYGQPKIVGTVPAGAFYPRPKVDSAIVRIAVDQPSRFPNAEPTRFFEIVRAAFGVRRKQLHNALARGLNISTEEASVRLAKAGIDSRRRAETLSLEEWSRVYQQFR